MPEPFFVVKYLDGSVVDERALCSAGVRRPFAHACSDASRIASFEVRFDGGSAVLDLVRGEVLTPVGPFSFDAPPAPVRIIYYRQRYVDVNDASSGTAPQPKTSAIGIGWQSTVDGKNIKFLVVIDIERREVSVVERP